MIYWNGEDVTMKEYTDITFELFNYCNGSCSGCMLNSRERQIFDLASSVAVVKDGLKKIADYGSLIGLNYRVVFSFGDVPKLDWDKQKEIYEYTKSLGLAFGLTLTCVDPNFDYKKTIIDILEISNDLVFDITVDPFRLRNPMFKEKYLNNLKFATQNAPNLHLQTLLSNPMMNTFTPQELVDVFSEIGDYPVFMGFSPTIENLTTKDRYGYELKSAFEYAHSFYNVNDRQKSFLGDEIDRFAPTGEYKHFSKQTFHIDSNLNVYPVSYSIYGDIIQDKRNNVQALGNLFNAELKDIIWAENNKYLGKLNAYNKLELDSSGFNCKGCKFRASCEFQGIGLIRKTYKAFEQRVGHCYGPIHLAGEHNGA